jgi:beta-phosphoglucomutase
LARVEGRRRGQEVVCLAAPPDMFPATLFDFNGVLVDDEAVHLAAFRDALAPLGITLTDEAYVERYLGFDDRGAFQALLRDNGQPADDAVIERLIEAKRPLYLGRARTELPTFAGAAEAIRRRAAHGPIVIVSGALRDEIVLGLEVLGVSELVAHIVSADDTRAGKPDPEGYLLGLDFLTQAIGAARARKALVIEDSLAGIDAARAARLACAAVAHSYPRAELVARGADLVVDRIDELGEELIADAYRRLHG